MLAVPEVVAVNVAEQVDDAVVPDSVQVVNVPASPFSLNATVPAGVTNDPAEVSVTVTLHVEPWLITAGVAQLMVVEFARRVTVTAND